MFRKDTRSLMTALCCGAALCVAAPAQAQLAGFWQFEGDFTDSSSNGNDGTGTNATFVAGQAGFGQALNINTGGGNGWVEIAHDSSLDITGTGTFAAWVNADDIGWEGILAKAPSSNGSGSNHAGNYELRLENGSLPVNLLYQRGGVGDTTGSNAGAVSNVTPNVWTHVAVTIDGTDNSGGNSEVVRTYINGFLVDTRNSSDGFGATNTNSLFIGRRGDTGTLFNGPTRRRRHLQQPARLRRDPRAVNRDTAQHDHRCHRECQQRTGWRRL